MFQASRDLDDFPHFIAWCKAVEEQLMKRSGLSEDAVDKLVEDNYGRLNEMHSRKMSPGAAARELSRNSRSRENPIDTGSFVNDHPWLTALIILSALGTIVQIVEANRTVTG